mmetsp:Transcript_49290/g.84737  ORF Transcript_49290/g.84737 Transcript_49290/m.84737 type:complete len:106 (-) Transcript_49290:220-537(-)
MPSAPAAAAQAALNDNPCTYTFYSGVYTACLYRWPITFIGRNQPSNWGVGGSGCFFFCVFKVLLFSRSSSSSSTAAATAATDVPLPGGGGRGLLAIVWRRGPQAS